MQGVCLVLLQGNEARHFSVKADTTGNRAAAVAPAPVTYTYTRLPGLDTAFVGESFAVENSLSSTLFTYYCSIRDGEWENSLCFCPLFHNLLQWRTNHLVECDEPATLTPDGYDTATESFTIATDSALFTLATDIDFEVATRYVVTLQVTDTGSLQTGTIVVRVSIRSGIETL